MQFMLVFNESGDEFAERNAPEAAGAYWGAWSAFIGAMTAAGVLVKGDVLTGPELSTTVRVRDGKRSVQDGPFADTKEALAGYVVIEVPNLDAALEWAVQAPCARRASVEVRPVLVMPPAPGK
jgi:hypothetical protein